MNPIKRPLYDIDLAVGRKLLDVEATDKSLRLVFEGTTGEMVFEISESQNAFISQLIGVM